MAARLTAAEAKRLGIETSRVARPRTTRIVAKGTPYHMRCVACSAEFTTIAAEDRHLAATGHHRYETVLS